MDERESVKDYDEGYGTGLPDDVDFAEIELRALKWLTEEANANPREPEPCRYGLDELHAQLYTGKNHLLTRVWLKHLLFQCHYGSRVCGYQA